MPRTKRNSIRRGRSVSRSGLILLSLLQHSAVAAAQNTTATNHTATPIPLLVTNSCPDTIWPGIGTQHGIGPGTGGFELAAGTSAQLYVGRDWQGRVWGRTNCTFNGNENGVNGGGAACMTGDCYGVLNCQVSVCSYPPLLLGLDEIKITPYQNESLT